ncbi:hypothetical protein BDN72DRAFT_303306 [Pluteus cervinus]|uniref:Uncharacterized protein n=1 Tax=Pluteus cervinus TaxID=181527 RepID=A0ACD3B4R0_9AGAR|nr:hypothetical protein BDN72DRAFT_303306 [Pluteus cervinus]
MSQQINNNSYIIHKFILFLLFIAAIFNSLGIQVQLDVVLRPTATGHGLTVVVEVSDNGLFASFISVVIDQGGTLANAGQPQRNVTYASDGWKHRPEPSRSVHLDLYGLHCIMDPELTDNGLAKALAINDIQFSTRPPQGASEPVPEFEAWVIKEASNWFASPPGAYEGVFKEKCPVERSEWCQINDKEQEELKESEEVNRIGGQSKEMVLTMVDERAYSGLPTRPHAS